jgi:hypothetical protein
MLGFKRFFNPRRVLAGSQDHQRPVWLVWGEPGFYYDS